jgi:DNA-binding response OmpR family regulator/Tfp pilus assembly protein PilF
MSDTLSQAKILVIDDFQGMRTMLRDFVRAMGVIEVDTAANGKEALRQLRQRHYDIVICDFNLGDGQNGQQVLEEARFHDHIGVSTIWIMVTAEKTTDMVMCAAEVKPDDYLLKPINQDQLENRIKKLIVRKHSLRDIEEAINAKDYATAIAKCDQQLQAQAVNPQDILRIKSELLLTVGNYPAAKAVFESVQQTRSVPWAKTGLGKVCYHTGNYAGAKELFQQVLSDNRMFMEASDWLVKALEALGDGAQAQQVLLDAVKLSPNSATRLKVLGDTAYRNGALDIAQAAFATTLKISEYSVHKSPAVYAGLAKVLAEKNTPDEALKVLARCKGAFKDHPEAAIQTAAVESAVYQKMGQADKAEAAMANAEQMMSNLSGQVSPELVMEMAQSLLALGKRDKASDLMRDLVKNNHENAAISRQIEAVFDHAQLGAEGRALIKESQQEVVNINNQGVMLAKKGEFMEGAKLLRTAVSNLPRSEVVIMNLCGLLIGQMSKQGPSEAISREVKELLERIRELNPANKNYHLYVSALARASGQS